MFDEAADRLRTRFGLAAKAHARSAMVSYRGSDAAGFYLNAGISLELAIKARLMAHGAFTIGPDSNGWFRHVLQVVKDPNSNATERAPKTIGGVAALARLRDLEPEIDDVFDKRVKETIDRCETVKHIGLGDPTPPEELLSHAAAFVRAHDALLQVPPADYWGDEHPLTEQLVAEQVDAVAVGVKAKFVGAASRVETLGASTVAELADSAAQRIADSEDWEALEWAELDCPVCGSLALAYGHTFDDGEGEAEYEGPGEVSWHWIPRPVTLVETFFCEVCQLRLSGGDELREGNIPLSVDNSRVDPSDLVDSGYG